MRDKKNKSAKAKRGGKKAPAGSPNATGKRKRKRGGEASPTPTPVPAAASGCKPAGPTQSAGTIPRETEPPALSTTAAAPAPKGLADKGPAGPALPGTVNTTTGERRRWPERHGPATVHGDSKRSGSESRNESGESGDAPPRANKLVPTNAVHPTERRIKRRLHKNGAFMAAAAAALLGVLILTNQSEPPDLMISERQIASRLPLGQDWQSDVSSDSGTLSEAATRSPEPEAGSGASEQSPAKASTAESKQASAASVAPTRPVPPLARPNELNVGEVFEMQRILARLDLAPDEPNGVLGDETTDAIRTYQQIAGLPVDGEASRALLIDMREVVRILDGKN